VDAFLLSFGIIFIAELGDKSQLMAMTFATRYRALTILLAITVATALVHLLSVMVGAAVGAALPPIQSPSSRESPSSVSQRGHCAETPRRRRRHTCGAT
jgi:putative Ca2+/H+ antiporter (TMEM165/GDT1 family)